jgi:rhamnosyltransferase subunit B
MRLMPQADWPVNVTVTGAIPYNGPRHGSGLSPELDAFLDAGPPPIVFTLGSSVVGAAGSFYEESLEAVHRLGERAVMLVGSHAANRPGREVGDGVLLQNFARHSELFPRASVVVHQGGAGTLYQALASSRPTLVVPFAHDQPDNAYRVQRLGVSRTLRASRYRARRVERELRRLLGEPSFEARAAEIGATVRAEDGVRTACDAIERALGLDPVPTP